MTTACVGNRVLIFALGWPEFTACALRAKNDLFGGLLPRDIVWRLATIAAFAMSGLGNAGSVVKAVAGPPVGVTEARAARLPDQAGARSAKARRR